MQVTIRTRLSPEQARRAVLALPAVASGRAASADSTSLQLAIGMVLLGLIKRSFLDKSRGGGGADGVPWESLAPSTLARRRVGRGRGAVALLRDTGVLFNSFGPGAVEARPGEVAVGTNVPYARWQHEGVPGRLPARRLWPEPEQWPSAWWQKMGEAARQGLLAVLRKWMGGG